MLKIFQMVPQVEREHLCQSGFPSLAFVFLDNGIKKSCDFVLVLILHNKITVQIQVFILHIPLHCIMSGLST